MNMVNTTSIFSVLNAKESDAGKYECVFFDINKNRIASATLQVVKGSEIVAIKVPKNINVVEGEPLKIECLTKGHVYLEWKYGKCLKLSLSFFLLSYNFEKLKLNLLTKA